MFYSAGIQSEALAKAMQKLLLTSVNPGSSRQAKPSTGIYLMEHVKCPAVLIECGFLSNSEEEKKLRDPEYQKNLCAVLASAVACFIA